MTKEEILAMKAGRELDALVAEKVMGYTIDGTKKIKNGYVSYLADYKPSTDINTAWDVVIKMKVAIYPQSNGAPKDLKYLTEIYLLKPFKEKVKVFAETAPLAICKAALLAVME